MHRIWLCVSGSILKGSPVTASQITNLMTQQRQASGLLTSLKHLNVRYKYPEGFPCDHQSGISILKVSPDSTSQITNLMSFPELPSAEEPSSETLLYKKARFQELSSTV
jgi:hypothetical protein